MELGTNESKIYPAAGRCVYCGATRYDETQPAKPLSDEHIVAYSLGGKHVLPKASCRPCAEETSKIELSLSRGLFHAARTQLRMPSYRKNKRPTHFPLDIDSGSGEVTTQIAVADYPALVVAFRFTVPDVLLGLPPTEKFSGGVAIATLPSFGENMKKHPHQRMTWKPRGADAEVYGRALAKIAHAYAVAEIGLERFKPYLANTILGRPPLHLAQFVGSDLGEAPSPSNTDYELAWAPENLDSRAYVVVRIRLLAKLANMPVYRVVAGELI